VHQLGGHSARREALLAGLSHVRRAPLPERDADD
jgi:hypothetical protein